MGKRKITMAERDRKARIRRIRRVNTGIRRAGRGKCYPRLVVDHQSFELGYAGLTLAEARWVATMLAIALNRFKFGD